jgi:hypothetical protein
MHIHDQSTPPSTDTSFNLTPPLTLWLGGMSGLSGLIMVVQIDGIHISEHLVLVAAIEIDSEGFKHPLGLIKGATWHSAARTLSNRASRLKNMLPPGKTPFPTAPWTVAPNIMADAGTPSHVEH